MVAAYVPERGDVVWLLFDPQAGHEQSGRRPALVISPRVYNDKAGLALVCPITSRVKKYPFEVSLPPGLPVERVVLADQIKSVDWRARNAELIDHLPTEIIDDVIAKILALLE